MGLTGLYTYQRLNDGFSIYQMTPSPSLLVRKEANINEEQRKELQEILQQKFHYLGKGCQFYAFESDDKQYVLKFFKQKHLRPFTWLNTIPMTKKWRLACDIKIERRKERAEKLFSSCQLAYDELSEETGVIYVHLDPQKEELHREVVLVDKLGLRHAVDIDHYEFVLQRKALPAAQVLLNVHDDELLQAKIKQLVDLVIRRCEKDIIDTDKSFVQNVAFYADKDQGIIVDIGQLIKSPKPLTLKEIQQDVQKRLWNLRVWSLDHMPQLTRYIDEEMSKYQDLTSS